MENKQAEKPMDYLFSPVMDRKPSEQSFITPKQTRASFSSPVVSAIKEQSDHSLPPSPDVFNRSNETSSLMEGSVNVEKLSARSKQMYLKNLKILNEDSMFEDDISVAHVSFNAEEKEDNEEYEPDNNYYAEAFRNYHPPEVKEETDPSESTFIRPNMSEMMKGYEFSVDDEDPRPNNEIHYVEDSLCLLCVCFKQILN